MKLLGFWDIGPSKRELAEKNIELSQEIELVSNTAHQLQAAVSGIPFLPNGSYVLPQYRFTPFNGEKNDGELGPILNYVPDYYGFAQRSWGLYMTSDIAKTIIDKYIVWIIDQGLRLKSNPVKLVLESEGIQMDAKQSERFNDISEARWTVWANSKESSLSGMQNLKEIAKEVKLNSLVGGDILVIQRYVDGIVKIQLVDGRRIMSPSHGEIANGNIVSNGVEMTPDGKHVKYWMRGKDGSSISVPAFSNTGLRVAFLVKGSKWTLDYHRGLPKIAVVMESIGKLERYKEAVVSNAEEVAKIVTQIIHQNFSDGSNPFSANGVLTRFQSPDSNQTTPFDDASEQLAQKISATYNKQVINMVKGAEMKPVQPSTTIRDFEPFYTTNAHVICAAVGIPPNVAFSLYTDSFSASRAATKDWDHTIDVERDDFTDQFYMHIYKFWLFSEIMTGKIDAPGFVEAFMKKNFMVIESYTNARFTGPHFPHIDPLKEVKAEREKLGAKANDIPLTTVEAATEALGCGDSDSNMEQFADEIEIAEDLGIISPEPEEIPPIEKPEY